MAIRLKDLQKTLEPVKEENSLPVSDGLKPWNSFFEAKIQIPEPNLPKAESPPIIERPREQINGEELFLRRQDRIVLLETNSSPKGFFSFIWMLINFVKR
jgi:hypothetical protein